MTPSYTLPPPKPNQFPSNTHVTMTTREVTIFLQELGEVRQELGKALARLEAFEPQFQAVAKLCDRLDDLERSVEICQTNCGRERVTRTHVWHWIAYAALGLVPGAATWFFTHYLGQ